MFFYKEFLNVPGKYSEASTAAHHWSVPTLAFSVMVHTCILLPQKELRAVF